MSIGRAFFVVVDNIHCELPARYLYVMENDLPRGGVGRLYSQEINKRMVDPFL
ncbi:hypothetical protein MD484_g2857, partial [Candolleomyces efflorescens]